MKTGEMCASVRPVRDAPSRRTLWLAVLIAGPLCAIPGTSAAQYFRPVQHLPARADCRVPAAVRYPASAPYRQSAHSASRSCECCDHGCESAEGWVSATDGCGCDSQAPTAPPEDGHGDQTPSQDQPPLPEPPVTQPETPAANDLADIGNYGGLDDSFGATSGSYAPGQTMIGDFFGSGISVLSTSAGMIDETTVAIAGGDRRFKVSENNQAIPIDRLFFNLNGFQNSVKPADATGTASLSEVDRFTLGFEKAFGGGSRLGLWSVELRVPFAVGLNSSQHVDPLLGASSAAEFGNVALTLKKLFYRDPGLALSGGVGITLPTANDFQLFGPGAALNLTVDNQSVHFVPFLAVNYAPGYRFWANFFVQADFDANGNEVRFLGGGGGRGVVQDQSLLFLDLELGYWLYRDAPGESFLPGLAGIVELHYASAMQNGDLVASTGGTDFVGGFVDDFNVLNITAGLRLAICSQHYLTIAAVAPLTGQQTFESEFGVQLNTAF